MYSLFQVTIRKEMCKNSCIVWEEVGENQSRATVVVIPVVVMEVIFDSGDSKSLSFYSSSRSTVENLSNINVHQPNYVSIVYFIQQSWII